MEPLFLTVSDVVLVHRDQIERYGGTLGIRDTGLLQSAVSMPAATFGGQYVHTDLCEMAAGYLFHLIQNHPLIDGNKRVGAATAHVFLLLNGLQLLGRENDNLAELAMSVARGETGKSTIAEFFRFRVVRYDD